MAMLPVVQNPRRKTRRLSTKQLRAGFGGKRRMKRRSSKRRNPGLATLANPRKPRRSASRVAARPRRRSSRRRNPAFLGGLTRGFDFSAALWVGVGAFGSRALPRLVKRFWPGIPTVGMLGYATRAGGTLATAFAVKMATGSIRAFQHVMAGGLGYIVADLLIEHVGPRIGLSGLSGGDLVMTEELVDIYGEEAEGDMGGYVDTDLSGVAGYVDTDMVGITN